MILTCSGWFPEHCYAFARMLLRSKFKISSMKGIKYDFGLILGFFDCLASQNCFEEHLSIRLDILCTKVIILRVEGFEKQEYYITFVQFVPLKSFFKT